MRIAVIGGTGIYDPAIFGKGVKKELETPYGRVADVTVVELKDAEEREVIFLPRHGVAHGTPPHRVNYRANIYALKLLGVTRILATNSVGCINQDLKPGDVILPNDFLDLTKGRAGTFYDTEAVHVDVSEPYCPELRNTVMKAARDIGIKIRDGGVYACTEGPRFETPAEIRFLGKVGADLVGMTGLPEAVLAREQEMCYASICTVTNYAAGIAESKLTATEVLEIVAENREKLRRMLARSVNLVSRDRRCGCKDALRGARV